MSTLRTATAARNAMLNALAALANNGFLRIYGSKQPDSPDTAANGAILADLDLENPAFGTAAGGVIKANAIGDEDDAPASGRATWFRVMRYDGTPLWDGSAGESGADLILDSVEIKRHARVSVESLTYTLPQ